MRRKKYLSAASVGLACLALWAIPAVWATDDAATETPGEGVIHEDAAEIEAAVFQAVKAFVDDDSRAARAALDRIDQGSPALDLSATDTINPKVLKYDRGFHLTLDRAREHAGAGEADEAFDQFVWVLRTCRDCHRAARKEGTRAEAP